jgi:hypothetical protein
MKINIRPLVQKRSRLILKEREKQWDMDSNLERREETRIYSHFGNVTQALGSAASARKINVTGRTNVLVNATKMDRRSLQARLKSQQLTDTAFLPQLRSEEHTIRIPINVGRLSVSKVSHRDICLCVYTSVYDDSKRRRFYRKL